MKQFILKHRKAFTGTFAILLIGAVTMSFQDSHFANSQFYAADEYSIESTCADTLPDKEGMKMKDLEKLQSTLDESLEKVYVELKNRDLSKLQKEIETSLKDVDMDKIRKDVDNALKSMDMEKIMADVSSSLKSLNNNYKNEEIEKALAEARKEIEKAKLEIKEIDRDAIKKELDNAKKEIEKSKIEIDKIDITKIMDETRAGIDKAKAELSLRKEMFNEMEKDGLIDPKKGFTIEYKNKELLIDGKKQSEKTTEKYRKYFKEDHFKITIDKE
jgi:hypothetical protein